MKQFQTIRGPVTVDFGEEFDLTVELPGATITLFNDTFEEQRQKYNEFGQAQADRYSAQFLGLRRQINA